MCSVHIQITKQIQDSEIKTSNSLFHLVCLDFFSISCWSHRQNYASHFAISSPLICSGYCLAFYRNTGELSLQLCILPSVGFHSSWTAIWTRSKQPFSNVGQRADVSRRSVTQNEAVAWYGRSQVMLQNWGDYRWADSRYQTCDGAGGWAVICCWSSKCVFRPIGFNWVCFPACVWWEQDNCGVKPNHLAKWCVTPGNKTYRTKTRWKAWNLVI